MKKTFLFLVLAASYLLQAPIFAKDISFEKGGTNTVEALNTVTLSLTSCRGESTNTATTDTDPPTAKCVTDAETLELEQGEFNTTLTLDANVKYAQLYYPIFPAQLSSIKVRFSVTNLVGNVTLSVFKDDGGINALGAPLSTVTLTNLSITDDYATFQLPSPVPIVNFDDYYLVLETTGNYELNVSDADPYRSGLLYSSPTNVTNYSGIGTGDHDLAFSVFIRGLDVPLNPSGNAQIAASDIDDGSSDACGIKSLSLSTSTFDCIDARNNPHTVTLNVTDNNDNQSSCTATVIVRDTVAPIVECFDLTVELDENGFADFVNSDWSNEPSDNCGIQRITIIVLLLGDCTFGESSASLSVEDYNRNRSSCVADITVKEYDPPVALCKDHTVDLDANGIAYVSPGDIDNGSSDACGIKTMSASPNTFDCQDIGNTYPVLLFVVDKSDNNASCTANVTVADLSPPVISCPTSALRRNTDPGACNHIVGGTDLDPSIADNCQLASFINDYNGTNSLGGETLPKGKTTVTWTATDARGNSSTCTYDIRIRDREAPVFDNCPQSASFVVPFCSTGIAHTWPTLTATDNCTRTNRIDINTFPLSGSFFPLGITTVNAAATDKAGNVGNCSFDVIVTEDCDPIPGPISHNDIGHTGNVVGKVCYDSFTKTYQVKTSGSGIPSVASTTEGFHYVWTNSFDMVVDVRARIVQQPTNNYQDRVGVMIRQNGSANAASVSTLVAGNNQTMMVNRAATGMFASTIHGPVAPGPLWPGPVYWVRLHKVGTFYYSYVSADGVSWTFVSAQPNTISGTFRVGIAAAAGTPGQSIHYIVDNFTVNGTAFRLEENDLQTMEVSAFPNPVQNSLNVVVNALGSKEVRLSLSNALGQELIVQQYAVDEMGMVNRQIDMQGLAAGVYLLEVRTDTETKTIKVRKF